MLPRREWGRLCIAIDSVEIDSVEIDSVEIEAVLIRFISQALFLNSLNHNEKSNL